MRLAMACKGVLIIFWVDEMTRRTVLKRHIKQAWKLTLEGEYFNRRINNEAGLQAHFVKHLGHVFEAEDVERQIFVEPPFRLPNAEAELRDYVPDVVVCSARKIIGVIELKYTPRGLPRHKEDLNKLCLIFSHRSAGIELCAERYMGPVPEIRFEFSIDVLLTYAAVHRGDSVAWRAGVQKHLGDVLDSKARRSIFLVGAGTKPDEKPEIWTQPLLRK